MPEIKLKWNDPQETSVGTDLNQTRLVEDVDDQEQTYILSRQIAHEYHHPAVQELITAEKAAEAARKQAAMTEMDEFRKEQAKKQSEGKAAADTFAAGMVNKLMGREGGAPTEPVPAHATMPTEAAPSHVPENVKAAAQQAASPQVEAPMIDPTQDFAAGFGAKLSLEMTKVLVPSLWKALGRASLTGAVNVAGGTMAGFAGDVVGAKVPELALPVTVAMGLFSGTIEPIIERGIANAAAKMGQVLSPEQIKAMVPQMQSILANESGQIPIRAAKRIDMETKLPGDDNFKLAVKNTEGAEITPDGLKLNLTRFQPPEAGGMPSVRSGVFYLPEGSPNKKFYSTGKQGYGGSEKITGETLVRNPLFVKGATGGKAPEHAYDLINGKGAYEQMRKDALDVNWGRSAQGRAGGPDIEDFLDKYAPDLSGQGQYILDNSKKGNTLAYALQEAAVAHSVREKGYDAVIGYGVGRKVKEPFISEVFDVREDKYPTKFGDYSIHPDFKISEAGTSVSAPEISPAVRASVIEELNKEIANTPVQRVMQILKDQSGQLTIREGKEGVPSVKAGEMDERAGQFLSNRTPDITGELAPGSNIRIRSVADYAPKWLDEMGEEGDITRVVAAMSETFSDKIEQSTRGVVSHAQTALEAQGLKVEDIMGPAGRQHGGVLPAAHTKKLGDMTVESMSALMEMRKAVRGPNATDLDRLAFMKTFNGAYMAMMQYAGNAAELGRAVEIHKAVKRATGLKVGELRDFMQGLHGKSPEEIAKMMGDMENFGEMAQFIKQGHRASTIDMWNEAYINGMLWLPTTHLANTFSNVLTDAISVGERYVAAAISQSPIGSGQIGMAEAQAYPHGMVGASQDAMRAFARVAKTGQSSDIINKLDLGSPTRKAITGENVANALQGMPVIKNISPKEFDEAGWLKRGIDFMGTVTRVPGRMLLAEDEFFKVLAYRGELHAQATRISYNELAGDLEASKAALAKYGASTHGMSDHQIIKEAMARRYAEVLADPDLHAPDIKSASADQAKYLTFTSPIDNRIVNAIRGSSNPFLKMLIPFTSTPWNIFRYASERTPGAGFALRSMRDDFMAGGARRDMALAKQAVGLMLWGAAVGLVVNGQITGYGPREPSRRAAWLREGNKPYSTKFGDYTVEWGRFEPFASVFGIAADATEILGYGDDALAAETDKLFPAFLSATAKNYSSKTFLKSVQEGIDAIQGNDPKKFERLFEGWAKSSVPFSSVFRGVEQVVSPERKEVDGMIQAMQSEIPGLSDKLEPKLNLWAEPLSKEIEKGESILQTMYRTVSPIYISKRSKFPIDKELWQELKRGIPMPSETQSFTGDMGKRGLNVPIELSQKQYNQFLKYMNQIPLDSTGMKLRDSLNDLVKNDPEYAELKSKKDRKGMMDMIDGLVSEAKHLAKDKMYETDAVVNATVNAVQEQMMNK